MNTIKNCLSTLLVWAAAITCATAQSPSVKSDFFETGGKIYVVVAVLAVIFLGILALLISLERRLAKIEKEEKEL